MIDLIYPFDIAPVVPAPTAGSKAVTAHGSEWFPIVLPSGMGVGRSTREYCHSGAKPLHPVIHIHIIDRFSRIYLQKRSMRKDIQPGKWDTAVGGHVDLGESVEQALVREIREELGITLEAIPSRIGQYVFESDRERELVFVHKAVYDAPIFPSDELDGGRFWPLHEIKEQLEKGIFTPNFESEFLRFEKLLQ